MKPIVVIDGEPRLYDWCRRTCDLVEVEPREGARQYVPGMVRTTVVTRDNHAYTFYGVPATWYRASGRAVLEFYT